MKVTTVCFVVSVALLGLLDAAPIGDQLKILRNLLPPKQDKIEARNTITAFITDPSLLVTILHSLEIAYWTLPFGFILTPIMNIFRMPNRRRNDDQPIQLDRERLTQLYLALNKAIAQLERLQKPGS